VVEAVRRTDMSRSLKLILSIVFGSLLLVGCSASSTPESAVENYLKALEAKDDIGAVNAACLSWEEGAFAEASSFEAVGVVLEGLSCSTENPGTDAALVHCAGEFVADYGGEIQNIDISLRTFHVIKEDGIWKMCGYQ
jgi:hypothetical protein